MLRTITAIAAVALLGGPGAQAGQTADEKLVVIEAPGFVFDSARHRAVHFGGGFGASLSDATWEYDGGSWRRIRTPGPSRRNFHAMAYDDRRQRVVLFGGHASGGAALGDTWEYDGSGWRHVSASGPAPRGSHAMAYDRKRGKTVLYGGSSAVRQPRLIDTWEWDGHTWSLVPTTAHPAGSELHGMTYDKEQAVVVAFGGRPANSETWVYDGVEWRRASTVGPGPREHLAMAYAANLAKVLLFGGFNGKDEAALRDLWEWDGRRWSLVDSNGPHGLGANPGFVADDAGRRMLLLGTSGREGVAGFWEWNGRRWLALPLSVAQ
jgi:hypothetical protein